MKGVASQQSRAHHPSACFWNIEQLTEPGLVPNLQGPVQNENRRPFVLKARKKLFLFFFAVPLSNCHGAFYFLFSTSLLQAQTTCRMSTDSHRCRGPHHGIWYMKHMHPHPRPRPGLHWQWKATVAVGSSEVGEGGQELRGLNKVAMLVAHRWSQPELLTCIPYKDNSLFLPHHCVVRTKWEMQKSFEKYKMCYIQYVIYNM